MAQVIAEIRLSPGEVGYYDDYSRIYLNASKPTAKIYSDTNTIQIRRSIRSGRLRLISGSLGAPATKAPEKPVKVEPALQKQAEPEPIVPEPTEIVNEEETKTEPELTVENVEENSTEETAGVAEETIVKPKRRSRKKQAADAE